MHHVIPAAKLTESYFRNLCRNIGLNQRQRARIHRRETRTCMAEIAKWGATLLLCCTMHPLQARWLLRMRTEITRGMFTAPKNNTEMRIIEVEERIPFLRDQLLKVWENSVRATHLFLSDAEIKDIKKYVPQALREVTHLLIAEDETGNPIAFMGVDGARLEMLFVAPEERGKGIGKNLLRNGIERYAIRELTVNEQNPRGTGILRTHGISGLQKNGSRRTRKSLSAALHDPRINDSGLSDTTARRYRHRVPYRLEFSYRSIVKIRTCTWFRS